MNSILAFVTLIKSVGWSPPWVFARSLAPVFVWQATSIFAHSMAHAEKLAWAVLGYVTVFFWTRVPFSARIIQRDVRGTAAFIAMSIWGIVASLVLLAPDPVWLQRYFTVLYAVLALCCLIDVLIKEETSLTGLRSDLIDTAGPQLVRTYFLYYVMLALLNETLLAHLSLKAWVLCLAMLPVFSWIMSRALTKTVWLSLSDRDEPRPR